MTGHLSSGQISEWLAGERGPAVRQHVAGCEQCRSEIARVETALIGFRSLVRSWSDGEAPRTMPRVQPREARLAWAKSWSWVAAAALVICLFAVQRLRTPERSLSSPVRQEISDSALFQQLDQQLSQSVPAPLQPLSISVAFNEQIQSSTPAGKASSGGPNLRD